MAGFHEKRRELVFFSVEHKRYRRDQEFSDESDEGLDEYEMMAN